MQKFDQGGIQLKRSFELGNTGLVSFPVIQELLPDQKVKSGRGDRANVAVSLGVLTRMVDKRKGHHPGQTLVKNENEIC